MGRPTEFTTDQIIKAGQALLAAGRNITGFALRQRVGGGNPTRLKETWDNHASKAISKPEPLAELPIEVSEAVDDAKKEINEHIVELALQLNDRAIKTAERRVTEAIREATEEREQAKQELADAAQTVEELETRLDEANSDRALLSKRLADLTAENKAQAIELAALKERLKLTEQHAKENTELLKKALGKADPTAKKTAKPKAANPPSAPVSDTVAPSPDQSQ